jgi:hypothetical protein
MEVKLPDEFRLRAIEETNIAKQELLEKQKRKQELQKLRDNSDFDEDLSKTRCNFFSLGFSLITIFILLSYDTKRLHERGPTQHKRKSNR